MATLPHQHLHGLLRGQAREAAKPTQGTASIDAPQGLTRYQAPRWDVWQVMAQWR